MFSGEFIIGDWGHSIDLKQGYSSDDVYRAGTEGYRAPELLEKGCAISNLKKCDVFSLGVLLFRFAAAERFCYDGEDYEACKEQMKDIEEYIS